MPLDRWFLTAEERGNPASGVDGERANGAAWTEGNLVSALIHGRSYFARLHDCLRSLQRGDSVWFSDWRGDAEERLVGDGPHVGEVFAELIDRGVDVRGLVWRRRKGPQWIYKQFTGAEPPANPASPPLADPHIPDRLKRDRNNTRVR